ncbi:MAG: hypothetical protein IT425_02410 [Pirellulales bacterium]|nr:hypothetical protein [Pirellulales bacterium]
MTRFLMAAALLAVTSISSGCSCCNWLNRPAPVAAYPAPVAACPAPACNPCTTAPVTYGTAAPVAPYTPPPQW